MLRKSKTIQEIYNEVSGYDLTITNDAPLATALNKLIDKSRLGYLAMTPKQIAKKFAGLYYEKIFDKNEITLLLFKNTNIPINLIHQTVKKIYEIWMYNAKFEFIPLFLSDEEKKILNILDEYDTLETVMENFNEDFYGNKKIAVVGEELFTLLDMEVLFKRGKPADRIGLFTDEEYLIDNTYVFSSDELLAENIADLINEENEDETAIVLNTDSEYLEIIKSLFIKKGLKVEEKYYLRDDLSVRTLISFLELSLDIENIEFKELIPLANEFGIKTKSEFNQYNAGIYVKNISKDKNLQYLFDICTEIRKFNFIELINKIRDKFEFSVNPVFLEMLETTELDKIKISDKSINDLKFILKEFDIETDSEKSGILFVNALNSAFIDRKLVFYIGLDDSWMRIYPDKDYLKKEEEEEKNRMRFQILIQQGEKKYYFVRNVRDYEDVIPCYYFSILSGKKADSFDDQFFNPLYIKNRNASEEYHPLIEKISAKEIKFLHAISPTSLNAYFRCPKYYSLGKLLPNEQNQYMIRGTLFHSFAELYFNHPEFTIEKLEEILDLMVNEMSYFTKNSNVEFVRSDFRIGVESIMGFLDDCNIEKIKASESTGKADNLLMDALGLKKIYTNTEKWIRGNEQTPVSGKIDLQYENKIVDYKSSAYRKTNSDVTYQSSIDYVMRNEYVKFDFQAIAYISYLRNSFKNVDFIYNFLLSNFRKQVNDAAIEKDCLTKIRYYDLTFLDHIRQDTFFETLLSDKKSVKLPEVIGKENYLYILDNLNLEAHEYFDKELLYNTFLETTNTVISELGFEFKNFGSRKQETLNENVIKPVARKIYNERTGKNLYGTVFKDDCDAFIEMVKSKLAEINEYNKTKFPFEPAFGSRDICKECDYLNLCTGNKLWH